MSTENDTPVFPGNVCFTVYFTDTGKIYTSGNCPPDALQAQPVPTGCMLIEQCSDSFTDYIVDGVVTPRPIMQATLDTSTNTISNIPVPNRLLVEGVWYDNDDSFAEIDYPLPGTYTVVVESFPYLDMKFTLKKV